MLQQAMPRGSRQAWPDVPIGVHSGKGQDRIIRRSGADLVAQHIVWAGDVFIYGMQCHLFENDV